MAAEINFWLTNGLILIGVFFLTVAAYGMYRLPDTYTAMHAAAKAASIGLIPILLAVVISGNAFLVNKAILIIAFILPTPPISSHLIAAAGYKIREPMKSPETIDESGQIPTE
jgi:multicomponent Na+:H+ antiporter subunit G